MKKILLLSIIALISSCQQFETKGEIKIGSQIWTARNLNVDKFNNGDKIPEAKTNEEWNLACKNKTPAWCYSDNDKSNGEKYGKIYNWYAVTDPRGLAPKGWHIPSKKEWLVLSDFLGGEKVAGDKLKSTSGWDASVQGNNESKFNGLPGGFRFDHGEFGNLGSLGCFCSNTESPITNVEVLILDYGTSTTSFTPFGKGFGMSVRCIKD